MTVEHVPRVGGDIQLVLFRGVPHGQTKVGDGRCEIFLDENISRLDVPVSDGRLPSRTKYLRVEVREARGDGAGETNLGN